MNEAAIVLRDLKKAYGKAEVLRGINLLVETGSVYALLGPNGAGKTTLINILATLIAPDGGTVRVNGYDLASDPEGIRRSISLTGQYAAVDEVLTGEENLLMMARLRGKGRREAKQRTAELLSLFDLGKAARSRVKTYSGGMRRRLDLAASLVGAPPIIILDEPTTGLDTVSRQALWDVISELSDEGTTIFLTTQYLEEADQLAHRIAVINDGSIVAEGTPAELKSRVGADLVELRDSHDRIVEAIPFDGSLEGLQATLARISGQGIDPSRITVRGPSLDEVFVALTTNPAGYSTAAGELSLSGRRGH